MSRASDEQAQQFWSYSRLGYDAANLAVLSHTIGIDPNKPPYPLVTVKQISDRKEVELLVCRCDSNIWMKIRVFVEGNQVAYLPYRTRGQTDMPDGLTAIRQQFLDSGLMSPPFQESINAFSGKFARIYKLPELTDWDRNKALEWLRAQSIPGTAVNLLHERAVENNTVPRSWVPVWLRFNRNAFKQGPISIAYIQQMADEAEGARRSIPSSHEPTRIIVGNGDRSRKPRKTTPWWEQGRSWLQQRFGHHN